MNRFIRVHQIKHVSRIQFVSDDLVACSAGKQFALVRIKGGEQKDKLKIILQLKLRMKWWTITPHPDLHADDVAESDRKLAILIEAEGVAWRRYVCGNGWAKEHEELLSHNHKMPSISPPVFLKLVNNKLFVSSGKTIIGPYHYCKY